MELTFPEIKLMVTLAKSELSSINVKKIQQIILRTFNISLSLQDIYKVLDLNFDEDFELENNKIKYYVNTNNAVQLH